MDYQPPEDCSKPDIEIGNYRLRWDGTSFGVPRGEAAEIKSMLRDIIPYITPAIYEAVGAFFKTLEEKAERKQARRVEEAFAPEILLTKRVGKDVSYTLRMGRDGGTLVSRTETISQGEAKVQMTWALGELVFDRQNLQRY